MTNSLLFGQQHVFDSGIGYQEDTPNYLNNFCDCASTKPVKVPFLKRQVCESCNKRVRNTEEMIHFVVAHERWYSLIGLEKYYPCVVEGIYRNLLYKIKNLLD